MKSNNYKKFMISLTGSFIIMYTVMFLNLDKAGHIHLSTTRMYMTLLMVTPMALLMLAFMRSMKSQEEEIAQMKKILARMEK